MTKILETGLYIPEQLLTQVLQKAHYCLNAVLHLKKPKHFKDPKLKIW